MCHGPGPHAIYPILLAGDVIYIYIYIYISCWVILEVAARSVHSGNSALHVSLRSIHSKNKGSPSARFYSNVILHISNMFCIGPFSKQRFTVFDANRLIPESAVREFASDRRIPE
jgi:hypothetical protein